MIPVDLGWLPRRRRPDLAPVPAPAPADLLAESEQRTADGAMAIKELVTLGPPGLGAHLAWKPDPIVFGPQYEQYGPHDGFPVSCGCGVQWAANTADECWNCGKPVTA